MPSTIINLDPFETLFDASAGRELPLPAALARLYGTLRFPTHERGPHVVGNLVSTVDGVVSLGVPGHTGGKDISGSNTHDVMLMGLLRACASAVVQGAGTIRQGSGKPLTPEQIYPSLSGEYAALRRSLGLPPAPTTVIVTSSGDLDRAMPALGGDYPVVIVTTPRGAEGFSRLDLPKGVRISAVDGSGDHVSAASVLRALGDLGTGSLVLVEGGPHLLAGFYKERLLHEQFLTLSPQIAGRDRDTKRLSLVEGATFAPGDPLWGELVSVRRGASHLFLRYAFPTSD